MVCMLVQNRPIRYQAFTFDEVDVTINKSTSIPGGIYDRRPSDVEGFVTGRTSGFYFDGAKNIFVRNCSVTWGSGKADYFAHALEYTRIMDIQIHNFHGQSAAPDKWKPVESR
jgi:hypothetical protein